MPNTVFSSATQPAPRMPTSTPSCTVKMFAATATPTNPIAAQGLASSPNDGPHQPRVSTNPAASAATASELSP